MLIYGYSICYSWDFLCVCIFEFSGPTHFVRKLFWYTLELYMIILVLLGSSFVYQFHFLTFSSYLQNNGGWGMNPSRIPGLVYDYHTSSLLLMWMFFFFLFLFSICYSLVHLWSKIKFPIVRYKTSSDVKLHYEVIL